VPAFSRHKFMFTWPYAGRCHTGDPREEQPVRTWLPVREVPPMGDPSKRRSIRSQNRRVVVQDTVDSDQRYDGSTAKAGAGLPPRLSLWRFTRDGLRRLVFSQPLKARMSHPAVTGPCREFRLGDKLRLGPLASLASGRGTATTAKRRSRCWSFALMERLTLDYKGHRPVRRASPAREIDLAMQFDRPLRRSRYGTESDGI
jgi:hypothetical protein